MHSFFSVASRAGFKMSRSRSLSRNDTDVLMEYIDKKFEEHSESKRDRKAKKSAILKRDSNQQQYNSALDAYNEVDSAERALKRKDYSKAAKYIKNARKMLKKRLKYIKMADNSDYGWKTVEEYMSDEVASDSADDRRIKRAEAAAAKKVQKKREESSNKRRRDYYPSSSGRYSSDNNRQFFRGGERKRFKYDDRCYACGLTGHWRIRCPEIKNGGKTLPAKGDN